MPSALCSMPIEFWLLLFPLTSNYGGEKSAHYGLKGQTEWLRLKEFDRAN